MNRVLLTVDGRIPPTLAEEIAAGRRPRADYRVMAEVFGADVVDVTAAIAAGGRFAALLQRVGGAGLLLGWHCFRHRRRYATIVTDSEQIGMPYAALTWLARRRPRHVMISHRLSAPKKVVLHRALRLQRRVDVVAVYASSQQRFAVDRLGYRAEQVVLTPFMVDTEFWRDGAVEAAARPRPLLCAVGQELRDYPTMIAATRDLDVDVVLAAASPWSKRKDTTQDVDIPANVTVSSFHPFDLRQLYTDASIVVVPLQDSDFQSGITTILEAMSMSRPLVCTLTAGQTDAVVDGQNGVYVPLGDAAAMRRTIERLLADPDEAARLAAGARAWAEEHAAVERYAAGLARACGITPPAAGRTAPAAAPG